MADPLGMGRGARVLLIVAALVVVIAGLRAASTLILPFLLAVFLAILSLPPLAWMRRAGLPLAASVLLTVAGLFVFLGATFYIVSSSVSSFASKSTVYQQRVNELRDETVNWLEARDIDASELLPEEQIRPGDVFGYVRTALSSVTSLLSNFFLVLLTLIFILFEASVLPGKLRAALGVSKDNQKTLETIAVDVQRYFGIKTVISLVTGVFIGFWTWAFGLDFYVLWGFLAFLLNFIPNIGSIMAAIPAVLLALVQPTAVDEETPRDVPAAQQTAAPGEDRTSAVEQDAATAASEETEYAQGKLSTGLWRALFVALGYLAVNMVMGNLVEPRLMGRRFGLSTLVVFLSLCFWGWVWGPIGMFLSVPLTMFVKILLENSGDLRWVAVLLSGDAPTNADS